MGLKTSINTAGGGGAAAGSGAEGTFTTGAITLAVSTSGSDTGGRPAIITTGDWSAFPFLTIQAALDSLPKNLKHRVIVDIGAGNFGGFLIEGFNSASIWDASTSLPLRGSLMLRGQTALATVATGVNTGFASGGGSNITSTLIKAIADANWTADNLRTMWLKLIAGTGASGNPGTGYMQSNMGELPLMPIRTNTTDTITTGGIPATPNGTTQYQIVDLTTVINALPATAFASAIQGNVNAAAPVIITNNNSDITIRGLKLNFTSATTPQMIVSLNGGRVRINSCDFRGPTNQFGCLQRSNQDASISYCQFVSNNSFIQMEQPNAFAQFCFSHDTRTFNTAQDVSTVLWSNNYVNAPTAGAYRLFRVLAGALQGNMNYVGGTGNGYEVANCLRMLLTSCIGSGISGYGFAITEACGRCRIATSSTAAGTTGDILIEGTQALTHAQKNTNVKSVYNYTQIDT